VHCYSTATHGGLSRRLRNLKRHGQLSSSMAPRRDAGAASLLGRCEMKKLKRGSQRANTSDFGRRITGTGTFAADLVAPDIDRYHQTSPEGPCGASRSRLQSGRRTSQVASEIGTHEDHDPAPATTSVIRRRGPRARDRASGTCFGRGHPDCRNLSANLIEQLGYYRPRVADAEAALDRNRARRDRFWFPTIGDARQDGRSTPRPPSEAQSKGLTI